VDDASDEVVIVQQATAGDDDDDDDDDDDGASPDLDEGLASCESAVDGAELLAREHAGGDPEVHAHAHPVVRRQPPPQVPLQLTVLAEDERQLLKGMTKAGAACGGGWVMLSAIAPEDPSCGDGKLTFERRCHTIIK
jgi:hypothetical protein